MEEEEMLAAAAVFRGPVAEKVEEAVRADEEEVRLAAEERREAAEGSASVELDFLHMDGERGTIRAGLLAH